VLLDEDPEKWPNRPLGHTSFAWLDARCEKVRHGGSAVSSAVQIAIGVSLSYQPPAGIREDGCWI